MTEIGSNQVDLSTIDTIIVSAEKIKQLGSTQVELIQRLDAQDTEIKALWQEVKIAKIEWQNQKIEALEEKIKRITKCNQ